MTRSPEELPPEAIQRLLGPLPADSAAPSTLPRDLQGVWIHGEVYTPRIKRTFTGAPLPLTQAGAELLRQRIEADNAARPLANASTTCRPPGQPKQLNLNFPFRIVQSADGIFVLFEEYHSVWNIHLRATPAARREYSGDSLAHWDGTTLVVETQRFLAPLWLDAAGTPVSEEGHLTHRLRKSEDGSVLEVITTVTDPAMYTQPWSFARRMVWRPDKAILGEYNCEQQVGNADGQARYGIAAPTVP